MTTIDFETLTRPIAADDPCGPDLDQMGDAAYMNFMASAEGLLPTSYFIKHQTGGERPFDRTMVDFKGQFDAALPLLSRTRDLRQLAILTKFYILDRDLVGFTMCLRALDALLQNHWESVHPRGEDGDFALRLVAIESINSVPTVVMPLQFLPLIEDRRYGVVSYRNYFIATGEANPRDDEEPIQLSNIEKALEETGLAALIEKRQLLADAEAALEQIARVCREKTEIAVSFDRLAPVVGQIAALLDKAVSRRNPSLALRPQSQTGVEAGSQAVNEATSNHVASPTRITCAADAAAALIAAGDYFAKSEPSSPALLLVRQASQLLGKSFLEVMRILVPAHLVHASVNIGKDQFFELPIEQLAALTSPSQESSLIAVGGGKTDAKFQASTRAEALDLLDEVARYFRVAEPPSPIPFLAERARDLAQRDFLSVLRAVLPTDTLKNADER